MVGNVAVLISMSNVIVLSVDPKTMGVQTGMNQTFRNLGSAIGPVLVTSILASYAFTIVTPFGPFQNYHLLGYQFVFGLVAAIGLSGALLSLGLRNFRFLADGTRSGQASGAPAPAKDDERRAEGHCGPARRRGCAAARSTSSRSSTRRPCTRSTCRSGP